MHFFRFRSALLACCFMAITAPAKASRFDVVPGRTGGPAGLGATCRQCHGNAVGNGSVEIVGVPNKYQANAVYDLTVRVSDPDKLGAGFQISVEDAIGNHVGALSVIDSVNTELNPSDNGYLNHRPEGVDASIAAWAANGNSFDFPVRWTAPDVDMGTVTFWAAGNAINNNFSPNCSQACAPGCCDIVYLANESAGFLSVPAASTWGLIMLGLSVLTAGTLLSRRPQSPPATVCVHRSS